MRSEEFLEILLEEGCIGVWTLDLTTGLVTMSGQLWLRSLFGVEMERIQIEWRQYLEIYCHPDDQARAREDLEGAVRGRASYHSEYRIWNGEQRIWHHVQAFGRIVEKKDGGHMICGIREILRQPREHPDFATRVADRFRVVMDAAPLSCTFFDRSCRPIDCNQEAVELFGLPDKQAYLDRFFELSPHRQPDGQLSDKLIRETIKATFAEGRITCRWVHQIPDGSPVPCTVTLARIRYLEDCIVVAYTWDERELHASYEKIREADRRARLMLEATPLCCSIWDENLNIVDCNQESPRFFGLSGKREFIDRYDELSPPYQPGGRRSSELIREYVRGALEGAGERQIVEWEHQKPDGTPLPVEMVLTPMTYRDKRTVLVHTRDLRRLRGIMDQMRAARDMAQESARAKSEFLANMSHEIRTPLNAIVGLTHLALKTNLTVTQRYYLEKCEFSAGSLLRIINDILDFSKVEAGKIELEQAGFSLGGMLQQVVSMVKAEADKKDLALELEVSPWVGRFFFGDALRLGQVLLNLLSNAVKFTDRGGVYLRVSPVSRSETAEVLRFDVQDTGIGMSETQKKRLFTPFNQADSSTTRQYGGTGLGLAICKSLVKLMGGEIWCESRQGGGSMFSFTVHLDLPSGQEDRQEIAGQQKRVLVIGDDAQGLEELLKQLNMLHCTVVGILRDADQASAFVEAPAAADVIFADMRDWEKLDGILCLVSSAFEGKRLPIACAVDRHWEEGMPLTCASDVIEIVRPLTVSAICDCIVGLTRAIHREEAGKRAAGLRVLLAEDNAINQMVAVELLSAEGCTVDVADNGRMALGLLEKADPGYDMVFMDIQMPVMDGLSATREIRRQPRFADLPVIAMTAHAMSGDREKSLEAGMNDHITKPIDPNMLYAVLRNWSGGQP